MLRWSTSLPGKNFRKLLKTSTKNPQIQSVFYRLFIVFLLVLMWVLQTRYCVKWKSAEAKLVLKITDNTTVSTLISLSLSLFAFIVTI